MDPRLYKVHKNKEDKIGRNILVDHDSGKILWDEDGNYIDTKKEYIICSACKRKQEKIEKEKRVYWEHLQDIYSIELGWRHGDIISKFKEEVNPNNQGFYTSKGRYINRKEAMKLAKENGQILSKSFSDDLYSEDIY